MSVEKSYEALFTSIQEIVDEQPQTVPQLLAIILAGGPFRPFLEKPDLLNKVVVMAKKYVAEKKVSASSIVAKPVPAGNSTPARGTGRIMSVRDVARPQGPSKA